MTSLFDTHVHLTDDDTDPVSYVERAVSAGVDRMLFCSSGMENSARNEAFAATSEHLFFAVGVHPHEAQEMTEPAAAYGERFAASKRMIAIGELGRINLAEGHPEVRCNVLRQLGKSGDFGVTEIPQGAVKWQTYSIFLKK